MDNQILSATAVNDTTVTLTFAEKIKGCSIDMSLNGVHWENAVCKNNRISGLLPGQKYYFRLKNTASNKVEVTMPSPNQITTTSCSYKGKTYKIGKDFFLHISLSTDFEQKQSDVAYLAELTEAHFVVTRALFEKRRITRVIRCSRHVPTSL